MLARAAPARACPVTAPAVRRYGCAPGAGEVEPGWSRGGQQGSAMPAFGLWQAGSPRHFSESIRPAFRPRLRFA